jgi:hypothetical protein
MKKRLIKTAVVTMVCVMMTSVAAFGVSAASIPSGGIPGLEPGKFYNSNVTSACSCHSWCGWNNPGTCTVFDGGIQCAGFARKVYNYVTGKTCTAQTVTTKNMSITSGSVAQTQLQGLPQGTYIRNRTANGYDHSVAIYSTSSTSITVYQANYTGGACAISMNTYTWADYASRYPYLYNYIKA